MGHELYFVAAEIPQVGAKTLGVVFDIRKLPAGFDRDADGGFVLRIGNPIVLVQKLLHQRSFAGLRLAH